MVSLRAIGIVGWAQCGQFRRFMASRGRGEWRRTMTPTAPPVAIL